MPSPNTVTRAVQ